MSHLFIVKRLELYMDLALYKINILLLLLTVYNVVSENNCHKWTYQVCALKRSLWSFDSEQTSLEHKPGMSEQPW